MLIRKVSRRDFLLGALGATSFLALGCGGSSGGSSNSSSPGSGPFDVAIVGAGLAGLTAAGVLRSAGKRVVLLEARDRVGGRGYSDNSFALPADLGAQWFHQGLFNPLIELAQSRGIATLPDTFPRVSYRGSTPVPDGDPDKAASTTEFLAVEDQVKIAGATIADGSAPDLSIDAAMTAAGLASKPWYTWTGNYVAVGTTLDQVSTLDAYNFSSLTLTPISSGTGEDILVPSGMGNFVTGFAEGLPIRLSTPVNNIDYSSNGVRLTTEAGTVRARKAIVTAPVSVLAAETIGFAPALPTSYLDALSKFVPAIFGKVWIQYNAPVFDGVAVTSFITQLVDQAGGSIVVANVYGQNVALVLLLAPTCGELESEGQSAVIEYAINAVNSVFPAATADAVVNVSNHPWSIDPFSRCTWAIATPGGSPGRLTLAVPIDNRIFLAGEALSLNSATSLLGAYQSGQVAADLALLALGDAKQIGTDQVLAAYANRGINDQATAKP